MIKSSVVGIYVEKLVPEEVVDFTNLEVFASLKNVYYYEYKSIIMNSLCSLFISLGLNRTKQITNVLRFLHI